MKAPVKHKKSEHHATPTPSVPASKVIMDKNLVIFTLPKDLKKIESIPSDSKVLKEINSVAKELAKVTHKA